MIRTIVTIEETDKRWLDRFSAKHHQSTAETIRMAIKEYQQKSRQDYYHSALDGTAGLLKSKDDSVRFVKKLREEWE